jgi:hypothetical protein
VPKHVVPDNNTAYKKQRCIVMNIRDILFARQIQLFNLKVTKVQVLTPVAMKNSFSWAMSRNLAQFQDVSEEHTVSMLMVE